ncbi:SNARE domain containing protein [Tritrichomonas foetus]|uniref:SNARE domain containing protein n=1 Tax=Tritrichomonas foetus TaxID=1144522 RepID=A0A1J4K6N3_9EUKA|nr:SNARE domain containing protein [Tritrichomonas foetus]|eukprot:OHT06634.1 SNARE domain containing protein [Tritrichomonas foetus]
MNRTSEFFKYLKQERQSSEQPKISQTRKQTPFSDGAQDVNRRLIHASETISTLRSLVKGGNILGQDDIQIQELIVNLNKELGIIDQRIKDVEKMKSQPQHAANVAQALRRNLAMVTEDFKSVIQERSEIIQKLTERRKNIGTASSSPAAFATLYGNGDEVEIPMQGQALIEQQRERYDMVRNVEQSITEILDMLVKLSEIIASHDYEIDRIDQFATETMDGIEKGHSELIKYFDKVKSNKCLMLKIFAILIFFAIIFILII